MDAVTAAAVSWKLSPGRSYQRFLEHIEFLTSQCANAGAQLVVMPENISLELLALHQTASCEDAAAILADYDYTDHAAALAQKHNLWLIAGTTILEKRNAAIIAGPSGERIRAEKIMLTQYEQNEWKLERGSHLQMFGDVPAAVTICYDAEFPESGRAVANAGGLIQCVPAFTESEKGFHRVRYCCHARSVENQIFVLHASLVGGLGCEPAPEAFGSSAIIAPPIEPFGPNSVLAETPLGVEGIAIAELDIEALIKGREMNDVRNFHDRNRAEYSVNIN